jgi:hypothetical protein
MVGLDPGGGRRDSDAGADLDQMTVDLVAFAEPIDDTAGQGGGFLGRSDILLKHHDFVAVKARDEVVRTQLLTQPVGDQAQQAVAAGIDRGCR